MKNHERLRNRDGVATDEIIEEIYNQSLQDLSQNDQATGISIK